MFDAATKAEIAATPYDTRPVCEIAVDQAHYVGIWSCESNKHGRFFSVEIDKFVETGWLEDGLIRGEFVSQEFFATFDEALAHMREFTERELKSADLSV